MFDSKQTLTHRIADATDLLIDFATLGEYGLEPVDPTPESCETRRRPMPIGDRESFSQVLFPNRHRGDRKPTFSRSAGAAPPSTTFGRSAPASPSFNSPSPCGSGQRMARRRGGRGASSASTADGAA